MSVVSSRLPVVSRRYSAVRPISARSWQLLLVGCLAALVGCGYKSAASQRMDWGVRTLAVLPLENRSTTYEVEQILTRQLVHALVEKSSFKIVSDASQADAVLSGSVIRLTANPVIFGPATLGSTFLVTMGVQVELKDRTTGRILYSNNSYVFREQYQINPDVENFFSERNPAIERIAGDFANAVVTTILEAF